MHKTKLFLIMFAGLFLFFPVQALAVEYEIDETSIDAYVTEDGDVNVIETHIYTFEDEFNGITRELRPKSGATIQNVEATEGNQSLEIEREGDLYSIHRAGDEETIEVEISYTIKDGLEVYEDMVQFYWPFFDRSNESTYENLTISIAPPQGTNDVIAFGYDEAFGKEKIREDGTVVFEFGTVRDGKKGDIRVAWNAELFSITPTTSNESSEIRGELLTEQQNGIDEWILFNERRDLISTIGTTILILFTIVIITLIIRGFYKSKQLKRGALREITDGQRIPPERITLPATISFLKTFLPKEAIPASLLDLVRKGNVVQVDDQTYKVINREGLVDHEEKLIEWLFDEIGDGEKLHLDVLQAYTKDEKNHETYQKSDSQWHVAIKEEIKENNLYQNKIKHRVRVGLSSLLLIPLFVLFPLFDLLPQLFFSIIIAGTFIVYAVGYSPLTEKGKLISIEWAHFTKQYEAISTDEWESWTEDEKMRSYLYGFGTNDQKMKDKNNQLVDAFELKNANGYTSSAAMAAPVDVSMIALYSVTAGSSFHTANESVAASTSTSSATSSGGGVGGGGGGSGAF